MQALAQMLVSSSLNFKEHITWLNNKISSQLGLLSRVRNNLTVYAAERVFTTMILPKLDYCNFVWNNLASRYKTLQNDFKCGPQELFSKDGNLKPGLHYRKFLAHSSGEIGTGAKKELSKFCLHCTIFTVPKFWAVRKFSRRHAQFSQKQRWTMKPSCFIS